MRHIWLIGMMGTGKTTVGAIVADRLGVRLTDTDAEVMERSGRTIPDLFAESESVFRVLESEVIADVAAGEPSVVATGGGAILDPANVARMGETGIRILLEADTPTLQARLGDHHDRPLLRGDDDLAAISEARRSTYREACDVVIDTTGMDLLAVAEEVIRCVPT